MDRFHFFKKIINGTGAFFLSARKNDNIKYGILTGGVLLLIISLLLILLTGGASANPAELSGVSMSGVLKDIDVFSAVPTANDAQIPVSETDKQSEPNISRLEGNIKEAVEQETLPQTYAKLSSKQTASTAKTAAPTSTPKPTATPSKTPSPTPSPETSSSSSGYGKPVASSHFGDVTSKYGYRSDPFTGEKKLHNGTDFAWSGCYGAKIYAVADGTVTRASDVGDGFGKCVVINHGDGMETYYAHCSSVSVKVGSKVEKGDVIAKIGSTGRSTGNHLHFGVKINGSWSDPMKLYK